MVGGVPVIVKILWTIDHVPGLNTEVCAAFKAMHEAVHKLGVVRISSDIRIGTRTDKSGSNQGKIAKVESILAKDKT